MITLKIIKMYKKRKLNQLAVQFCPLIALLFCIIVTITTLYINQGLSIPFIFISIQVYLNWYSIIIISHTAITFKRINEDEFQSNSIVLTMNNQSCPPFKLKYWYCDKCFSYTYRPTQHCIACTKCFHYRDHHCFFIGTCIIQQNIGNFICICFYASLACVYSLSVVGPYLYENLIDVGLNDDGFFVLVINFCFPVAFVKFVSGETSFLLLVTLFDALLSVFVLCVGYATWKFYCCLSGKQKYYGQVPKKQNLKDIFGNYGLWIFLIPHYRDGTLGFRGNYQLKQI